MGRRTKKSRLATTVGLAPTPVRTARRGKKLVVLLALVGIGALVRKNLLAGPAPTPYEPPAYQPPVPQPPVAAVPVPEEPVAEEPAVEEPTDLVVPEAFEQPAQEPEPGPEPEPAQPPAESLTSFFDQVLTETEEAKKPRKR